MNSITYKIAENNHEMEQIYRLNHETFAEEIPQHETNEQRQLIDRFNDENTYVIATYKDVVIGMIAVRRNRPFSLDQKLDNLDAYFDGNAVPCEIRLLSIKKSYRGGVVFYGLCERLVSYCLDEGYTMALISGTVKQTKLYKHMGFKPFGPVVGTEKARFQPMYLTKENFESSSKVFRRLMQQEEKRFYHYFLPGPVMIREKVKDAWEKPAISHRSAAFHHVMQDVQDKLCQLTHAKNAEVVVGTGTMANDMIAAQLSTFSGVGLILANGEFGERLLDHGDRWNLAHKKIHKAWNTPITPQEVDDVLTEHTGIQWLWTVHCETSTGYIFSLDELNRVCEKHDVYLCVDACSSVGVIAVDLSNVYLASTVSGKGLASYPGLAIVFHQAEILPNKQIPAYLDIGQYQSNGSVPYTHSSNSLVALQEALRGPNSAKEALARLVRSELSSIGMSVLHGEGYSPGIITISLPKHIRVKDFGDRLKSFGIHVSYESSYLLKRNWFQVALMGEQKKQHVMRAIRIIQEQYDVLQKDSVLHS